MAGNNDAGPVYSDKVGSLTAPSWPTDPTPPTDYHGKGYTYADNGAAVIKWNVTDGFEYV